MTLSRPRPVRPAAPVAAAGGAAAAAFAAGDGDDGAVVGVTLGPLGGPLGCHAGGVLPRALRYAVFFPPPTGQRRRRLATVGLYNRAVGE